MPVILAGILEGPRAGVLTGAIFGAFSMYQAATIGTPIARLLFLNPMIAFGPRILIGIVAYFAFRAAGNQSSRVAVGVILSAVSVQLIVVSLAKPGASAYFVIAAILAALGAVLYVLTKGSDAAPGLAALLGTLTNTVGVLGLGVAFGAIPAPLALTIAVTNSPAEVFAAVVVTTLIYKGVRRALPERFTAATTR